MPRSRSSLALSSLAAAVFVVAGTSIASAKCTRLAFSVNDYGKEGPTRDAKALLDKYIATWTAQRGIKRYTTGKKDVKCELFLDFGFFDEHTCKASATVCWNSGATPAKGQSAPSSVPKSAISPKAAPASSEPAETPGTRPGSKPKAA
jgi:hypothetical protein